MKWEDAENMALAAGWDYVDRYGPRYNAPPTHVRLWVGTRTWSTMIAHNDPAATLVWMLERSAKQDIQALLQVSAGSISS
jgi:hypothetical protein